VKQKKSRPFTVGFGNIQLIYVRGKQSGGQYIDELFVVSGVPEMNISVDKSKNRMVFTYSGVIAWFEYRASLADNNGACRDA